MRCALVGNQNSGKSLLFNTLTGMNQKVGNWSGVTVEIKTGFIKGLGIKITDLPGIYSLSPYSAEENLTKNFIIENDVDLVINIIDSTSIERSLYLTTQLQELGKDIIIALNMEDILLKKGLKIDIKELEKLLNITIVSISALKKTGIDELKEIIKNKSYIKNSKNKIFDKKTEELISLVESKLDQNILQKRFIAIKILDKDKRYEEYFSLIDEKINDEMNSIINDNDIKSDEYFATKRYEFIEKIRDKTVRKTNKSSITGKIDNIVLNKWLSIPIFIIIMAIVFSLSVGVIGGLTVNLVDAFFNGVDEAIPLEIFGNEIGLIPSSFIGIGLLLGGLIESANGSPWAISLIQDGIIAGVGAVCNFIPQLIILFLLLSLLETSGYMSRITFLFDKLFKKIGLRGKSLISFIVGVGCSVPAIMSSRIIEDNKEHKMTVTLTPFIPCNAKLPIIACICGSFFPGFSTLATISMYFLAIIVIIFVGWILNKFVIKSKSETFLLELPDYHLPSASYVLKDTLLKTFEFIKRAGTIILLCSIIVWFLASFTYNFTYIDTPTGINKDGNVALYSIDDSLLAWLGRCISRIFYPMIGIGHSYNEIWGLSVSAIQGLVAKEQVVSSMQIIAKVSKESDIFTSPLFSIWNPVTAFAYLSFNLFSAPCFGAIGAMKRELGSTKVMFKAIALETGFAWTLATIIGIIGGLLTIGGIF